MHIGVAGITGRIGRLVAAEIPAAGAVLQGGTCRTAASLSCGTPIYADLPALAVLCDAIIDFTRPAAIPAHAQACAAAGCAWILGTTGMSPVEQDAVRGAARRIAVVQAANFSPGVHIMLALAERLGALLPAERYDAEILETHHRHKQDAPSGTALAIGSAIATGRGGTLETLRLAPREGRTEPREPGGIGFASLRGGQIAGEHHLILTADDEQIVLTHRAFDRGAFARGAVRAALWSAGKKPGLYGMRDVLDTEVPA